jgi:hypothetical protein
MMVRVENNCTTFIEFATNLYKGIRLIYNPILNNNNKNLQEKFGFLDSLAHQRK